jgi:hypothetical protein
MAKGIRIYKAAHLLLGGKKRRSVGEISCPVKFEKPFPIHFFGF